MRVLDLSGNTLGEDGAEKLAQMLDENMTITDLVRILMSDTSLIMTLKTIWISTMIVRHFCQLIIYT